VGRPDLKSIPKVALFENPVCTESACIAYHFGARLLEGEPMQSKLVVCCAIFLACGVAIEESNVAPAASAENLTTGEREAEACRSKPVLPASRRVAGRSQLDWSKEWWRWLLAIPADKNPELVLDVDCGFNQRGPVFYLPGFSADNYVRTCRVPEGKFVLAPVWTFLNDFPCPDPSFQPAPNQTLEQFLQAGAAGFLSRVSQIQVTLDGKPVDYTTHRLTSGLFNVTGDPTLTAPFDGCLTGSPQPAVTDGWWLMLAPLEEGTHRMVVTAVAPSGRSTSQTFVMQVH
jgi:hypothetical protein